MSKQTIAELHARAEKAEAELSALQQVTGELCPICGKKERINENHSIGGFFWSCKQHYHHLIILDGETEDEVYELIKRITK